MLFSQLGFVQCQSLSDFGCQKREQILFIHYSIKRKRRITNMKRRLQKAERPTWFRVAVTQDGLESCKANIKIKWNF